MCRFLWPSSSQWMIAGSGSKSLMDGPFSVRVELLTRFIWLKPRSTTAVLMETVIIISETRNKHYNVTRTSSTITVRSCQFTMSWELVVLARGYGNGAAAATTVRSRQFKLNQRGCYRCREHTSGTLHLRLCARGPKMVISGTLGHTGTPNFQAWYIYMLCLILSIA